MEDKEKEYALALKKARAWDMAQESHRHAQEHQRLQGELAKLNAEIQAEEAGGEIAR